MVSKVSITEKYKNHTILINVARMREFALKMARYGRLGGSYHMTCDLPEC